MSAQQNRATEFFSLIVSFQTETLLDVYPGEVLASRRYKEMHLPGDVLICYADNLPTPAQTQMPPNWQELSTAESKPPFCCGGVRPYKPRRLEREIYFSDLERGQGNHPGVVFEIKRQVDSGPMLSTSYKQLIRDNVVDAPGTYSQKLHAFKNYKCAVHGLFFGVDLYKASGAGGYNRHHVRLNPFQRVNEEMQARVLAL